MWIIKPINPKMNFWKKNKNPKESKLFKGFDNEFNINDFMRKYTDNSQSIMKVSKAQIEKVFIELGKSTPELQNINCFACGYGSCLNFATAVANGNNDVRNCINYSRYKLTNGREEFDELFDVLGEHLNQMNDKLKSVKSSAVDLNKISMQTKIISINASIEAAHAGAYGKGFSVVASEIKNLANKSGEIIEANQDNQESLIEDIKAFEKFIGDIKEKIDADLQL